MTTQASTLSAAAAAVSTPEVRSRAGAKVWTGRVLSALGVLFLTFDAVGKLMLPAEVVKGTTDLGYPASVIVPLGILQVVLLIVYLVPRTSILGALLWGGLWLRETRLRHAFDRR